MGEAEVLELARQALQVTLLVAGPMLMASLVIGIFISLIQVATSIQDATLTFVPKIIAVGVTLLLAGAWMIRVLTEFTHRVFSSVAGAAG